MDNTTTHFTREITTTAGYIPTNNSDPLRTPDSSVVIVTYISGGLSIFGSFIIFLTYCIVDEAKNQTRRLLLYLTIADLITAVGNVLGAIRYSVRHFENTDSYHNNRTDEICVIQSFITTTSTLASFAWTIVIALHLLLTLVYQSGWCFRLKTKVLSHALSWGLPLIITVTAAYCNVLGEDIYGSSGPWCWIRGDFDDPKTTVFWMTITGKGWEILTYVVTGALYIVLKIHMYRQRRHFQRHIRYREASASRLRDEDEYYLMLWFFMYILRLWGTVRYGIAVYRAVNMETFDVIESTDRVLMYMQSIGDSGQAFCNCILFCLIDGTVRKELYRRCRRCESGDTGEMSVLVNNEPM